MMRTTLATFMCVVSILATRAFSQAAGSAPQPGNATAESAIKSMFKQMNDAMAKGDWGTLQKILFDDGSPAAHRQLVGHRWNAAQVRMAIALDEAFGKNTTPALKAINTEHEAADKRLETMKITVSVDKAKATGSFATQTLVLRDGKWMIDAGATAQNGIGIPDEGATPLKEAQTAIFEKIIPEISDKKFKSFAEFQLEIAKRLNAIPDPAALTKRKVGETKPWLEAIGMALAEFQRDNGRFPTTQEGLDALMKAPASLAATWKGPYWKDDHQPLDAWGNRFVYENQNAKQSSELVLLSCGPDGKPGTGDDVKAGK